MPPPAIKACFRKWRRASPSSDKKASISSLSTPSAANNSLSTASSMARSPSHSFSHPIICSLLFQAPFTSRQIHKAERQRRVQTEVCLPTLSVHIHIEPPVKL